MGNRPQLHDETIKRMKQAGVNPHELSDEQLEALEGMENPEKAHWSSRWLFLSGLAFGLGGLVNLVTLHFGPLFVCIAISLLLFLASNRVQRRITGRKFQVASRMKEVLQGILQDQGKTAQQYEFLDEYRRAVKAMEDQDEANRRFVLWFWFSRLLFLIGVAFSVGALVNLVTLRFGRLFVYLMISLVLFFASYSSSKQSKREKAIRDAEIDPSIPE